MSYLYERLAATRDGSRALSAARLRYQVLKTLHRSLARTGLTQVELAKRLGVRKSAVNQVFKGDGNLRISTLADYLHEMGSELKIELVPLGTQRAAAVEEMDREWRVSRQLIEYPSIEYPSAERQESFWDADQIDWHSSGRSHVMVSSAIASE